MFANLWNSMKFGELEEPKQLSRKSHILDLYTLLLSVVGNQNSKEMTFLGMTQIAKTSVTMVLIEIEDSFDII
jgi:hypothetical protein